MRWSSQYERLAVYGTEYAIATSHPTASAVGLQVLANGGNAVDAALAAHAVLCVVEPGMTGVGGDCFALYYDARSRKIVGINGSGYAPAERPATLTPAMFGPTSPHAVTIPGAVDAWCRLSAAYGTRPLDELFAPAMRLAEDGTPLHRRVAWDWANEAPRLATNAVAAQVFLPGGRAPKAGERHAQPNLARTLGAIARHGRSAFYEGAIAEDMVTALRALGGTHSLEDFAEFHSTAVDPVATDFAGHRVVECPPNSQGVIALLLLNVLDELRAEFPPASEADHIHLLAEATKSAYDVRDAVLADEGFLGETVAALLSRDRARGLARRIKDRERRRSGAGAGGNTTYLCAVDRDGNCISFINSLFDAFGSCIVAPKSGVLLNNRGLCFSLRPQHPNAIGPRKRPMHTIIPGMITMPDGRPIGPFGVMGGHYQAAGHANFVLNLLVRAMDPQQALNAPRSFATEGVLRVEATLGDSVVQDLQARGHDVLVWERPIGGGQAIMTDLARGVLVAGSDPRKDGCALAR